MICEWDTARFLIFSGNGEPLIYYSHITSILIFAGLLAFTFLRLKEWPKNSFRLIALSYIIWLFCDLVLWANENINHVIFFWTILNMVEPLIFVSGYAYFIQFSENKILSERNKWFFFALLLPVLLMGPLGLSVVGFDFTDCDRNAWEGVGAYYNYFVEALLLLLIVIKATIRLFHMRDSHERVKLFTASLGICLLFVGFLVANFLGTFTGDYVTSQYGHVAVPIFAAFLAYITIKYESFEPRILLIDTLVVALFILLLSLLFVDSVNYQIYANIVAFVIMVPLGYTLVTGIRKEVRQRHLIEKQEQELEVVNAQQENLLHFISHEIKGYLTKGEAGFAGIVEGDYGAISETLKGMASSALSDVRKGVRTVMEILDSSNLKKGTVNYKMQMFDLRASVTKVVNHLKPSADEKHLTIAVNIPDQQFMLWGDEEKMRQHVLRNLIDNAIKYTPKGAVQVELGQKDRTMRFSVQDNGIGITPDDMKRLFTEGGHGADSIKINVHSTGYGLFIAKQIVEVHKGKIWAESGGEGKGSKFIVEFPSI